MGFVGTTEWRNDCIMCRGEPQVWHLGGKTVERVEAAAVSGTNEHEKFVALRLQGKIALRVVSGRSSHPWW